MSRAVLHCGDVRDVLARLPERSVQCVVTSPPYFNLRDYGMPGQIGMESTVEEYTAAMVEVFWGIRRVMRHDAVAWLNLSDSYASNWPCNRRSTIGAGSLENGKREARPSRLGGDLKDKDLCGVPWTVALALRADGWWLRSDVIWSKPNPMPESVTDRPTRSHEYLFLLTKAERYYYDAAAIAEDVVSDAATIARARILGRGQQDYSVASLAGPNRDNSGGFPVRDKGDPTRNARSVWTIATQPYPEAHFATFPEELARRCILAGSSNRACEHCGAPWERVTETTQVPKDRSSGKGWLSAPSERPDGYKPTGLLKPTVGRQETTGWQPTCSCQNTGSGRSVVLDPFGGSGTVAQVATGNGRNAIYIDLNPKYLELARQRIGPMLCEDAA